MPSVCKPVSRNLFTSLITETTVKKKLRFSLCLDGVANERNVFVSHLIFQCQPLISCMSVHPPLCGARAHVLHVTEQEISIRF